MRYHSAVTLLQYDYHPPPDLTSQALAGVMSEPHESVLFMLLGLALLFLVPMVFAQRRQQRRLLRQGL